jgi:hypothetical protein
MSHPIAAVELSGSSNVGEANDALRPLIELSS